MRWRIIFQDFAITGVKPINEWDDFDKQKVIRFIRKYIPYVADIVDVCEDREAEANHKRHHCSDPLTVKVVTQYKQF